MFTLVQVFHRRLQVFKTKIMLQYIDKNKEEIAKGKCVEDLKYRLFYCSNFFTIRFSRNTNSIRLFDKSWQYASTWKKLFNIFHIHSHVQTRYVCSQVYFVTWSWRHGNVVGNSFRLFIFLYIRLFRVLIIDVSDDLIHLLGWTFCDVCRSFIQFTFWLSNTRKLIFILKPDEGVLCEATFIISLVKGLFQWTIYAAQEKISSNWEVIITFLKLWRGRLAVWNYENFGEQQRKTNAYRKNCIQGNSKFCSLKFTFVCSCAMNTNCISWNRCQ